jgi:hypothetical protein
MKSVTQRNRESETQSVFLNLNLCVHCAFVVHLFSHIFQHSTKFALIMCLGILTGCGAQPTPIAVVDAATLAPNVNTSDITQPSPLRYGIADHTLPYMSDIEQFEAIALVEAMPPNPDLSLYDVAVAYGVYDGWQQAPISHHVSLILNPQLAPLDNPEIQNLVRQALNPQGIIDSTGISGLIAAPVETSPSAQIRSVLANLGYPDGFRLTMAVESMPGVETVVQQLNNANLEIVQIEMSSATEAATMLAENRAHLLVMHWKTDEEHAAWVERVGENQVLDLYILPLSYVAAEGVTVSFTENGWAIGSR